MKPRQRKDAKKINIKRMNFHALLEDEFVKRGPGLNAAYDPRMRPGRRPQYRVLACLFDEEIGLLACPPRLNKPNGLQLGPRRNGASPQSRNAFGDCGLHLARARRAPDRRAFGVTVPGDTKADAFDEQDRFLLRGQAHVLEVG